MKSTIQFNFVITFLFCAFCASSQAQLDQRSSSDRCAQLVRAYCDSFTSVRTVNRKTYYRLKNGKEVICDDGLNLDLSKPENYLKRLYQTDLKSMLAYIYPVTEPLRYPIASFGWDPGRFRNEDLFDATYGATKSEVSRNMHRIEFLGKRVYFNQKNGASKALSLVSEEITRRYPSIAREFWNNRTFEGTFNWRVIAGTPLRSVHSWAAAIDMTTEKHAQYWKWSSKCRQGVNCKKLGKNESTLEIDTQIRMDEFDIPGEPHRHAIVDIFEKHGFIWGGKWHHFDSMHFEYRPEFKENQKACAIIDG